MATSKRNFPRHSLQDALRVAQKIHDEAGGQSLKRLLLADALGIKPSSTNFRDLLSSSLKYGLTEGTKHVADIRLTDTGRDAVQTGDPPRRVAALRRAALTPDLFRDFYTKYDNHKVPSSEMMAKLLSNEHGVPDEFADECATFLLENGRFAEMIRDIGGSPHVLLDGDLVVTPTSNGAEPAVGDDSEEPSGGIAEPPSHTLPEDEPVRQHQPRAIFIGHGKKRGPVEKLQKFLSSFQIPHKVVVEEANLARPIPQKVRDTMMQCGSAILIFTRDEKFYDEKNEEVWRPSENVVYELGAASYAYEDRVVVFKERGIHFPTNFQSIGYIEFEEDSIEAKTSDLLKELIGFGLVKVTPTG